MPRLNSIHVDKKKLYLEIQARGLTYRDVAQDFGYTEGGIRKVLSPSSDAITEPLLKMFEHVYNIKYDDIKPNALTDMDDLTLTECDVNLISEIFEICIEKVLKEETTRDYLYKIAYAAASAAFEAYLNS